MPGDPSRPLSWLVRGIQVLAHAQIIWFYTYVRVAPPIAPPLTIRSVCIRDANEAFSVKPRFKDDFQYLVLDVKDNESQNLISLFPQSVTYFIHGCRH